MPQRAVNPIEARVNLTNWGVITVSYVLQSDLLGDEARTITPSEIEALDKKAKSMVEVFLEAAIEDAGGSTTSYNLISLHFSRRVFQWIASKFAG